MKKALKILTLLLMVSLTNLFMVIPALAFIPPLPSSFYGTIKVNGGNIADGTMVKALINGQVYATGYTQAYEGNSVYSLDVPGDDATTTTLEGGREGDVIQFMLGEVLAVETGTWKSATNANVNLTASTVTPLNTPQATPTPVPTQTPIKLPKKSPTSAASVASLPTEPVTYPTLTSEPEPAINNSGSQVLPQPTTSVGRPPDNPTVSAQPSIPEENAPGNNIFMIAFIIVLAVVLLWALRIVLKSRRSNKR